MTESELLAVYGEPVSPELARTLDLGGYRWKPVANAEEAAEFEPPGGWSGAIVDCGADATGAWSFARTIRKREPGNPPVLALVSGAQLADLELRDELFDDFCLAPFHPAELDGRHEIFDDFCVTPFHPVEFEARLKHLLVRGGWAEVADDIVSYDLLVLNLETYQAQIDGRPLDLTYMEYELLRFLGSNPGRVFTRETLLSRVWGYEYYGGARTVDVHIRRLRAKLGEEHAGLIQTVRSVGYRFGQSRWGA
jgi:DNA-binding response OmpR family regulator